MKKDIIVAIIIGFCIGAVTALTLVYLPTLLKNIQSTPVAQVIPTITVTVTKIADESTLTLDNPKDGSVSLSKEITVSGKSIVGNTIVIDSQTETKAFETEVSGTFETKLTLTEGVNTITVTSYDEDGGEISKTIQLFYTVEKL